MEKNNKTLLIIILAIIAVAACVLLTCCAGTLFVISKADPQTLINSVSESSSLQEMISEYDTAVITTEETPQEIPEEQTDPNVVSAVSVEEETEEITEVTPNQKRIINAAIDARELQVADVPVPLYQTQDELREYLENEVYSQITDEDYLKDTALYRVLGFIPDDFDLKQFNLDLYTEQIAGFYDEETNQIYLISDIPESENEATLAHEITHYLQYNNEIFSETLKFDDDYCTENLEKCLVYDALTEGDALLVESLLMQDTALGLSLSEEGNPEEEPESSVFDTAPKYFQHNLLFPYQYGFDFVWYHYMKGGFDAINELYLNPPESIEQILHPEKYGVDSPVTVSVSAFEEAIEKKGEIITTSIFNENDVFELLNAPWNSEWALSERQAAQASEGWGGGEYIFALVDEAPLFFSKNVWDSTKDAKEAEAAFTAYNDKRFTAGENGEWKSEKGETIYFIRQDDLTYWMILPEGFEDSSLLKLIYRGNSL